MFGYISFNYIEAMAFRWNHAINIYQQHKDRIVLVKYEDFKLDKVIFDNEGKLGFSIQTDISNYVNIQYQPKRG